MATARFGIAVVGAVGTVAGVGIGIALALNVGVMVAVRVGVGVAVAVVVAVGIAAKERPEMSPADDLLSDIAAVCRGEMPPEPREGGSEAHRAAWAAVCALRSEVAAERAERDDARRMLAECAILTGTDTDGNTAESGWVHLWRRAVDDVSQLRADYDDHSDIERAEREVDRLRGEVERERAAVVVWLREVADAPETYIDEAIALRDASAAIENGEHRREGGECPE